MHRIDAGPRPVDPPGEAEHVQRRPTQRAITPCSTHSLNRRCALAEEIGSDSGSSFQAQPESSTYTIAA
jgi:hypothetical protein